MLEAIHLKNDEMLSLLEFRWAHRYGVKTFPSIQEKIDFLDSEDLTHRAISSSSEELEKHVSKIDCTVIKKKKSSDLSDRAEELLMELDSEDLLDNQPRNLLSEDVADKEMVESTLDTTSLLNISNEVDELRTNCSADFSNVSPPPMTSLKNLRRWLPRIEEDLQKAS